MSMIDYQLTWWAIVGVVLIVFALTAGFDLGIGALLPFVGKSDAERRVMLNVIGPTWDGNQVWLIIAGGALFVVWPYAYAATFSGFYGTMFMLLWALYMRPVGFEWRAKVPTDTWKRWWDIALFIGGIVPAFAFGLLIGNLMHGVPFHYDSFNRFYSDWSLFDMFNGFSVLIGFVSMSLLMMHGASYLQMRSEGRVCDRSRRAAIVMAVIYLVCFLGASFYVFYGMPGFVLEKASGVSQFHTGVVKIIPEGLSHNYYLHHGLIIVPILALVGAIFVWAGSATRHGAFSFLGSSLSIIATILTFGIATFPFILPSTTHPVNSLTIFNASSSQHTLHIMLIATCIMVPIILIYTAWVYIKMWRKLSTKTIEQEAHKLY